MSNAPTGLADEGEDTRPDVRYLYNTIPISSGDGWYMLTVNCDEVTGKMNLYHDCGDEYDGFVTERRQIAWWVRYWRSVAETGEDPLDQLYTEHNVVVKERWQVAFYESMPFAAVPSVCVKARKGGRGDWVSGRSLPEHVREFFDLVPGMNCADPEAYQTMERIKELALRSPSLIRLGKRRARTIPGAKLWGLFAINHTKTVTRTESEIKRMAKRFHKEEEIKYEQHTSK